MKIDMVSMSEIFTKYDSTKVDEDNGKFLSVLTELVKENSTDEDLNLNLDLKKNSDMEEEVAEVIVAIINSLNLNVTKLDNNNVVIRDSNVGLDIQNFKFDNYENYNKPSSENYVGDILKELNINIEEFDVSNNVSNNVFNNVSNNEPNNHVKLGIELLREIYEEGIRDNERLFSREQIKDDNFIQDKTLDDLKDISLNYEERSNTIVEKEESELLENEYFKFRNIFVEESESNVDRELNFLNTIAFRSQETIDEDIKAEPVTVRDLYIETDILNAVKYLNSNNIEELNVKMTPKDLGEISIKLLKEEGDSEVIITLANKKSFDLIKENIGEIENQLVDLNLKVKQVVIQMKDKVQNDFSGSLNQQFSKGSYKEERNKRFLRKDISVESNEEVQLMDDSNINLLI